MTITLTEEEARYLTDVIDWWMEDFDGATNDVIKDRGIEDPDELLVAVDGMHHLFALATTIKEKLSGRASPVSTL